MKTYYQILGVRKNCTLKTLKAAYKKMSQKLHPDKNKEDTTKAFQELKHAYEVIKDPKRRAHYDKTGNDDFIKDQKIVQQANHLLINTYMSLIERSDCQPKNYFFDMQNDINEVLVTGRKLIMANSDKVRKIEYLISHTEGGELLEQAMQSRILLLKNQIETMVSKAVIISKALGLLKEYRYTGEHRVTPVQGAVQGFNFINV